METNSSIIFFSLRLSSRRSWNKNTVFNRIRTKRLCFAIIWCHYQSLLKINIIIRDWILSARHLHRSACHFTPLGIFLKNLKMIIKGWRCCSHHLAKPRRRCYLIRLGRKFWFCLFLVFDGFLLDCKKENPSLLSPAISIAILYAAEFAYFEVFWE